MENNSTTPMLFPYEPDKFWQMMQQMIREEVGKAIAKLLITQNNTHETPGLTYKPLYKMNEICSLFKVTKPTIYDWIKHGKLKPHKIRSRVYFLWNDLQGLLQ
ncbi:MAG: helix-turn-helix domain-containing protein [Chitinophagaceae bacterium]